MEQSVTVGDGLSLLVQLGSQLDVVAHFRSGPVVSTGVASTPDWQVLEFRANEGGTDAAAVLVD